jgi:NDP-sugar pyrophosphorylase family protein
LISPSPDTTAVILAGGKGTRLKDLFPGVPKPLVPVAGHPFLHWLTLWLAKHGLNHFVYSTGFLAEMIEQWAQDESLPGLQRECCRENEPLGTGGGLLNCLDLCRDWILVANGDGLVIAGIDELLALRGLDCDGGLIGVRVDDTARFGSLTVGQDGMLLGFQEKVPGAGLINGGIYLFHKRLLSAFERPCAMSIETELFPRLLAQGAHLKVIAKDDAPFIDIGTPETVREAEAFVRQHLMAV